MSSDGYKKFLHSTAGMTISIICMVGSIVLSIAIICYKELARSVPTNYILLGLYTICMAFMVAFITAFTKASIVFMAASMTLGIVIALTIYAFTTKTDFTLMGGTFFVLIMLLLLFGIFALFT